MKNMLLIFTMIFPAAIALAQLNPIQPRPENGPDRSPPSVQPIAQILLSIQAATDLHGTYSAEVHEAQPAFDAVGTSSGTHIQMKFFIEACKTGGAIEGLVLRVFKKSWVHYWHVRLPGGRWRNAI